MLILTRHAGESIYIGDDIKICVLGIEENRVRLGFAVPKHIPVHREEIYYRILHEEELERLKKGELNE